MKSYLHIKTKQYPLTRNAVLVLLKKSGHIVGESVSDSNLRYFGFVLVNEPENKPFVNNNEELVENYPIVNSDGKWFKSYSIKKKVVGSEVSLDKIDLINQLYLEAKNTGYPFVRNNKIEHIQLGQKDVVQLLNLSKFLENKDEDYNGFIRTLENNNYIYKKNDLLALLNDALNYSNLIFNSYRKLKDGYLNSNDKINFTIPTKLDVR